MSALGEAAKTALRKLKAIGYNTDDVIYTGTSQFSGKVLPYGTPFPGSSRVNRFGGLFGSHDPGVAASHGSVRMAVTKNHASHDDFLHAVQYDNDTAEAARTHLKDIFKKHKDVDLEGDELEEALEYVTGEKVIWEDEPDMGRDRLFEIFKEFEDADIDWDAQGIKGEIARRLGYDSVGMPDEHGESILMLDPVFIDEAEAIKKKLAEHR